MATCTSKRHLALIEEAVAAIREAQRLLRRSACARRSATVKEGIEERLAVLAA